MCVTIDAMRVSEQYHVQMAAAATTACGGAWGDMSTEMNEKIGECEKKVERLTKFSTTLLQLGADLVKAFGWERTGPNTLRKFSFTLQKGLVASLRLRSCML